MKRILILVFMLTIAILVGCKKGESKPLFDFKEPSLNKDTNILLDANMAIDASDSEDAYKDMDTISFVETSSGITCTSKAFLGEKGIYLYAYVLDTNVYVSSEKEFYQNDSVEFYLDPNPEYSFSLEGLSSEYPVRTDCVQLRVNALGEHETWYGRRIGEEGSYPWAMGYFAALASAHVDGTINEKNGATGYSVEAFIPYSEMKLEAKPEKIGLLVAFNNVNNREDTSRTWFSYKGMSHQKLTSYIPVTSEGFQVSHYDSLKPLNANYNDEFYKEANEIVMYQVDENNENPEARAKFKFVLGEDGVYLTALVKDRVYSYVSDGIFSNDGIEVLIDTRKYLSDTIFESGVYRFSYDIAGGCQTDICVKDFNDYISVFNPTLLNVDVKTLEEENRYNYKYEYTYEAMIPYEVLGLTEAPEYLKFAFAVKTPNEKACILDRCDREGNLEAQDWLWIDKHYPQNPGEYYVLTEKGSYSGSYSGYDFEWTDWSEVTFKTDSPDRYNVRGYAKEDGLYFNMVQYVDNYNVSGDWSQTTHIEAEVWQHNIGYGWDGTYFAFFIDGSYYVNNDKNIKNIVNQVKISKASEGLYQYEISYEVFIEFDNNLDNPTDRPYAYVQLMSHTPTESSDGYENSIMINKDAERTLWADDCNSYEFRENGIVQADKSNSATIEAQKVEVRSGSVKTINNKIVTESYDTLALLKNVTLKDNMTYTLKMNVNSRDLSGVVFAYDESGYYYLYVDGSNCTINLCKVTNDKSELLYSNYISASYKYNRTFNVTIEFKDGKYYCSYFNTLHTLGTLELSGKGIGFASSVPGAQFYDVRVFDTVVNKDVNTLIIGHSYTELWTNYQEDFATIGLGENILNVGISGSHSVHWNKLESSILTYSPETLIYNIGVNDLFFNSATEEEIVNNIKTLLLNLKAQKGDLEVILLSLNHAVTTSHIDEKITITNNLMKQMASAYDWIYYVDIEDSFCDNDGVAQGELFTDGLHPTEEAYKNVIIPAIAKELYKEIINQDWDSYQSVTTDAMNRYQLNAHTASNGLYLQAIQYVDNYNYGGTDGVWNELTHIEFEIWQHNIGYGWYGTYFGFFLNGSYYVNNFENIKGIVYYVDIINNPTDSEYGYKLVYNIFIEFDNNHDNPADGPYAFVKFMSHTPGEGVKGYENTSMIEKDNDRTLWTDHCESYEIHDQGITSKINDKEICDATSYQTVEVDAPNRYEIYGYASDEGLVINAVQYVNQYNVGSDWLADTHIEIKVYNHSFGYGWDGTYMAFFMDGSYYINNETNVKKIVNRVIIEESDGPYKYKITYQVFIGFDNNLENPQDGPYGFVQFMSYTPGEDESGYENAYKLVQDGERELWKDTCESYSFSNLGIVERMGEF